MFTYCRLTFLSILTSSQIQVHGCTEMWVIVVGAKCLPTLEIPQLSSSFIFIKSENLGYLKSNLHNFLHFHHFVVYFYNLTNILLRRWDIKIAINYFINRMTSPKSISQLLDHFLDWLTHEQMCRMPKNNFILFY